MTSFDDQQRRYQQRRAQWYHIQHALTEVMHEAGMGTTVVKRIDEAQVHAGPDPLSVFAVVVPFPDAERLISLLARLRYEPPEELMESFRQHNPPTPDASA